MDSAIPSRPCDQAPPRWADAPSTIYSAFISYSHRDAAFAARLHRRLESYRLPSRLTCNDDAMRGDRRLRPIFLDRAELVAASDLDTAVEAALTTSRHLIVVCSPRSIGSSWVGLEIACFRQLHGSGSILAALPPDATSASIHPLLLEAPDGRAVEPLAADFSPAGDGASLALLKLVATLAGVRLDQLVQRDHQRRLRQFVALGVLVAVVLCVVALLAIGVQQARIIAIGERARGESMIAYQSTELRARLQSAGQLDLLDAANQPALGYYRGRNLAQMTDSELAQFAQVLQLQGQDDEKRSLFDTARAEFEQAAGISGTLLARRPGDRDRIFAQAQSAYWIGFIRWRMGDIAAAEAAFESYAALTDRLIQIAPANVAYRIEVGDASNVLGAFVLREYIDCSRAAAYLTTSLAAYHEVARAKPLDTELRLYMADDLSWLADVGRLRGDLAMATVLRGQERSILDDVLRTGPHNSEALLQSSANLLAVGRIAAERHAFPAAFAAFSAGDAIARSMMADDPDNREITGQVRIFQLFKARTWMMMDVRERPSAAVIESAISDCKADQVVPRNEELTDFCTILLARHFGQVGKTAASKRLLAALPVAELTRNGRLSEPWGIDLEDEIKLATDAK